MCKKLVATATNSNLLSLNFLSTDVMFISRKISWKWFHGKFIHKKTNTVDYYYTNFLSIMKPSLPVKKNLRKEFNESKKKLSTVWKTTLTCYEEKIHSDCLTTILYYQKPLMQQCKQIQLLHIFVYIKKKWCNKKKIMLQQKQKNYATTTTTLL